MTPARVEALRVRLLAETAVLVALSGALYAVKVFTLPQGGSITFASMVPVILLALRRGWRIGVFGGFAFGLVAMIQDASTGIYYPAQVLLDYPLAFGSLGLAGYFKKSPYVGIAVAIASRFICHFASGIIFFASFASQFCSQAILQSLGDACTFSAVYSAIYNGSFLIPELIISLVAMRVLVQLKALEIFV